MQTDLGGEITPDKKAAVSYVYAARYGYSDVVLHNDNRIRLFPRAGEGQEPIRARLWTAPSGHGVEYSDRFGNRVHRVRVVERHTKLVIATAGQVALSTVAEDPADVEMRQARNMLEGTEYTLPSPLVNPASVSALALRVASGSGSLLSATRAVTEWVYTEVEYRRGATNVATTAEQVASVMKGVCQDKTHLALGMLRSLGAPCRYVSGLLTGQTGETHSWLEFLHPECGWVGADPTRGVVAPPARDYVKLSVGRDYTDVSPVNGSFLSRGGTTSCAAIASVKFERTDATIDDALRLLEDAYVVSGDS